MLLDFSQLAPRDAYGWMISTILPRPIAWVSTVSPEGKTNLAPFSFFQGVTSNPPTLMFVPVNTRDGTKKDTVRNIEQVPEFVVNLVPFTLAGPMNNTSAMLPYGESEFETFGIGYLSEDIEVRPSFGFRVVCQAEQAYLDVGALLPENSTECRTVATVVAFAAQNQY